MVKSCPSGSAHRAAESTTKSQEIEIGLAKSCSCRVDVALQRRWAPWRGCDGAPSQPMTISGGPFWLELTGAFVAGLLLSFVAHLNPRDNGLTQLEKEIDKTVRTQRNLSWRPTPPVSTCLTWRVMLHAVPQERRQGPRQGLRAAGPRLEAVAYAGLRLCQGGREERPAHHVERAQARPGREGHQGVEEKT